MISFPPSKRMARFLFLTSSGVCIRFPAGISLPFSSSPCTCRFIFLRRTSQSVAAAYYHMIEPLAWAIFAFASGSIKLVSSWISLPACQRPPLLPHPKAGPGCGNMPMVHWWSTRLSCCWVQECLFPCGQSLFSRCQNLLTFIQGPGRL